MVEEGGTAVFQCAFHANPVNMAGIRWKKEGSALEEDTRTNLDWKEVGSNAVNSRLVLRNVTKADIGRYLCAVTNGIGGETVKETFLLVKSKLNLATGFR